ncbi:hypothetical protein EG68_01559 [Paragonimus skrjabini miyazakii]|uniref:SWIM-type domain-containing protein n=1 Tax=Paragonimus skrjabini miyazakii TaxID=59628 RepID=A0A8S9Z7M0_9TREM|nr:hypothetical protein EG68_01559 [Paragonimus skrjabini miyazakii]
MTSIMVPRRLTEHLRNTFSQSSQNMISDELLLLIQDIFGDLSLHALNFLEFGSLVLERSTSGRCLYRLESQSGCLHYCGYHTHFCPCLAHSVSHVANLSESYQIWCEHLLAIMLMKSRGHTKEVAVSDEKLSHSLELMYSRPNEKIHSM